MSTYDLHFSPMNVPSWLKHDDNVGNVYAVLSPEGHIGWVWRVPSSRSWVARHTDGSLPSEIIDCSTREQAGQRLAQALAEERDLAERGTVKHADIGGATFTGTISQQEMARLVRALGTYIADATEQDIRIDVTQFGTMQIRIGGGVSGASIDITDSVVHVKG